MIEAPLRTVIFDERVAGYFDPMDKKTFELERHLMNLRFREGGSIQGASSLGKALNLEISLLAHKGLQLALVVERGSVRIIESNKELRRLRAVLSRQR